MCILSLDLPYPPSVNRYWVPKVIRKGGRRYAAIYLTPQAKRYRHAVAAEVAEQVSPLEPLTGPLSLSIVARPPDRRVRDLDNILKATLDALAHAGVYRDDSQIRRLALEWGKQIKGGRLLLDVENLK